MIVGVGFEYVRGMEFNVEVKGLLLDRSIYSLLCYCNGMEGSVDNRRRRNIRRYGVGRDEVIRFCYFFI